MPGGDVNLTCVAVGSPMPVVRWRLGDVSLTPGDGEVGRNVLMLVNVTVSGNYTCIAHSDLGNIEQTAELKIKGITH